MRLENWIKKDRQVGGDTCRLEEESQKEIILLPLSDAACVRITQKIGYG